MNGDARDRRQIVLYQSGLVLLVLLVGLLLSSCAGVVPTVTPAGNATPTIPDAKTFTVAELAAFDGQDGNKAYVAVDGTVYDVSGLSPWTTGIHQGAKAGTDVTAALKAKSPHGLTALKDVPVVGTLVQ